MMQENNLLNRNSTNDMQGVKSTYAQEILISSIETENQLSYCGSTLVKFGTKIHRSISNKLQIFVKIWTKF